jgi:hypothetical protein
VPDRQGTCSASGCNFDHLMSGKVRKQSKLRQGCRRSTLLSCWIALAAEIFG